MQRLANELVGPFLVLGVARGRCRGVVVDTGNDERHGGDGGCCSLGGGFWVVEVTASVVSFDIESTCVLARTVS